ncbi:MAG: VirB3 family type IV secretion system protein [Bryobacteraceae bacterium]
MAKSGVYLSQQLQQEAERQILASSTFSVMNRRNLLFGVEADLFYAVLFTGIPCWNKTKSFGFTLLYLAVVLSVIWLLTRKDPDRPRYLWHYLGASQHFDAGRRRRFAFAVLVDR